LAKVGAPAWSDSNSLRAALTRFGIEGDRWSGKRSAMIPNAPMPAPFRDEFLRKEPPLGEPVGDYNEHILRCALMNQAIEGYNCTEPEIAAARKVIQASEAK
jgi:hypothetical protein